MGLLKRVAYVYILIASLAMANPARAYVDATPTLSRVIQDSTHIVVMRVVSVDRQRGVVLYEKAADLKGRLDQEQIKHRITAGLHPREAKTVLDWAEPGKTALFFMSGKVTVICIRRYWYECVHSESTWWSMTARPV